MAEEKWFLKNRKGNFEQWAREANISPIVSMILRNKDLCSAKEQIEFLNPDMKNLHSPWLFKDMEKGVNIIRNKILDKKSIRVIGDYDIDGICSTYILVQGMIMAGRHLGINADISFDIPDRIKDGYGINQSIIKKAYDEGIDTIITCDNGISAIEQIDYAKKLGMTVVVTDHHEVPFDIEDNEKVYRIVGADAVIDHKRPDCGYPFKHLCGAAIAYKFIMALFEKSGIEDYKKAADKFLEYAAIATIGDVVDLTGENRIIAKFGLDRLKNTENIGLDSLMDVCKINREKITAYTVGFVIGPCLNAAGRLDTAKKGLKLLMCDDTKEAYDMAMELFALNEKRKNMTEEGAVEAFRIGEMQKDRKVLVIYLKGVHESIAGIIAGRVREKFNKPAFVLTDAEDGNIKGSGRSIESYDMYQGLTGCKEYLTKFGGHKMAAGLSLNRENLELFMKKIEENSGLTDDDLIKKVYIDVQLPLAYASKEIINQLSLIEPFGKANEKPVFATKNVRIKSLRIIGNNQNICKMKVYDDSGTQVDALVFSGIYADFMAFLCRKFGETEIQKAKLSKPNNINMSVIYYPDLNQYNGSESVQIIINNYC